MSGLRWDHVPTAGRNVDMSLQSSRRFVDRGDLQFHRRQDIATLPRHYGSPTALGSRVEALWSCRLIITQRLG